MTWTPKSLYEIHPLYFFSFFRNIISDWQGGVCDNFNDRVVPDQVYWSIASCKLNFGKFSLTFLTPIIWNSPGLMLNWCVTHHKWPLYKHAHRHASIFGGDEPTLSLVAPIWHSIFPLLLSLSLCINTQGLKLRCDTPLCFPSGLLIKVTALCHGLKRQLTQNWSFNHLWLTVIF